MILYDKGSAWVHFAIIEPASNQGLREIRLPLDIYLLAVQETRTAAELNRRVIEEQHAFNAASRKENFLAARASA